MSKSASPCNAFSLIELLVVIGVIAVLAGLGFPAMKATKASAVRARAKGELAEIESAIERYKAKLGFYPPDNPGNWATNQLYYELLGTVSSNGVSYQTLDGSAQIAGTDVALIFGPKVSGFVNCTRQGAGDESAGAFRALEGLKENQYLVARIGGKDFSVLGSTDLDGPVAVAGAKGVINPWHYNSSSPRYNPSSFDLWMDVEVGGKTNRICNWTSQTLVVSSPY